MRQEKGIYGRARDIVLDIYHQVVDEERLFGRAPC